MTRHLTDLELGLSLSDLPDQAEARAHLATCRTCRARSDSLRATEHALARLGRETRRASYPDASAGWERMQARMACPGHRLPALTSARPLAWGAVVLTLLLVAGLATPLVWTAGFPAHTPPAVSLAPAWANRPGTTAPVAAFTLNPTPVPASRVPATVSGEGTALSQITIPPEPVPLAPGQTPRGGRP
jgi:hypothetical protein